MYEYKVGRSEMDGVKFLTLEIDMSNVVPDEVEHIWLPMEDLPEVIDLLQRFVEK